MEANDAPGGGCRTAEVTLPGFHHDICAAIHPMAMVSPLLRRLPLDRHRLEWVLSPAALAHPFDDGSAAVLHRSLEATGNTLGEDADAWAKLMRPFLVRDTALFSEILRAVRIPRYPLLMSRFGVLGLRSCASLVHSHF